MNERSKRSKRFTLIELVIVLVIIGIIIDAVLKEQDLIESARHDRLAAEIRRWEVATWIYVDRKGVFPGDANRDGIIGDGNVQADFAASGLADAPITNTVSLGGNTFYLFLGHVGAAPGARRNIIAVCVQADCMGTLGENFRFAESIDTSIDGTADRGSGMVRAALGGGIFSSARWTAVEAVVDTGRGSWTPASRAILYFFDGPPAP
jgi:hypothetical protein